MAWEQPYSADDSIWEVHPLRTETRRAVSVWPGGGPGGGAVTGGHGCPGGGPVGCVPAGCGPAGAGVNCAVVTLMSGPTLDWGKVAAVGPSCRSPC